MAQEGKEQHVANASDLQVGQMKEVQLAGDAVALLVRTASGFFATGATCTHYGAPLAKGVLHGERVLCPWHGACFNVCSGDIEDAPAMNALPTYGVRVDPDGKIFVSVAPKARAHRSPIAGTEKQAIVLVGGGVASLNAAQTLREEGFAGRLVMVTKEAILPYDRIKLSKSCNMGQPEKLDKILLRPASWYKDHKVEVIHQEVTGIAVGDKTVTLRDGSKLKYDQCLVATGSSPRKLNIPGSDLRNIVYVREPGDVASFSKQVENKEIKNVLIVGNGFIGMEVATWIGSQGVKGITVADPFSDYPMQVVFGTDVGKMLAEMHTEKNGVKFTAQGVAAFEGKERVQSVTFSDGQKMDVDLVVVGIGAAPNTQFLKDNAGFEVSRSGGLKVDHYLSTASGVYVAGDVAEFPCHMLGGEYVRIEHWDVAGQHGRVAARNMLGRKEAFVSTPIFWTMQLGSIRYCGHAVKFDEVVFDGHPKDRVFVGYYIKNGKIVAVSTFMRDPVMVAATELFRIGKMPSVEEVKRGGVDLIARLRAVPN